MARKFYFSKSRYCEFWQCPKLAWLHKHKPEARVFDAMTQQRFATGNEVGDLAMGLFGDFVEVTALKPGGGLDLQAMIAATEREMRAGTVNICEASFDLDGLYCAVDILRRDETNGGWAIYEVKSSTHPDNPVYAADVAYQKHVLEGCGMNVTGTYIVTLNGDYVLDGELDLQGLFNVTDISEAVGAEQADVPRRLDEARSIVPSRDEPDVDLGMRCRKPYDCACWDYCTRDLPHPNVFDLYKVKKSWAFDLHARGIDSFEDVLREAPDMLEPIQKLQIDHELHDLGDHADGPALRRFLDEELSYPLYFLDFETMMPVVPQLQGAKPYQQIPFQYSLHFIEHEGGELQHREFLAEPEDDPRHAIAESLVADIPADACVTAYNKVFECGRLNELAGTFPDLADHLRAISGNIVDLVVPFRQGWYYNRAMNGSFSIKSVLPALFPDDPELDYHALEGVHNGTEAMTVFPKMAGMPPEQRAETRHNLLEYCKLDTLAMVKVWEKLREATGE